MPTNSGFNHGFKVVRNGFLPSTVLSGHPPSNKNRTWKISVLQNGPFARCHVSERGGGFRMRLGIRNRCLLHFGSVHLFFGELNLKYGFVFLGDLKKCHFFGFL